MSRAGTDDAQALRELERIAVGLPAGIEVVWLGVSGYRLTYEGVSLFIDAPAIARRFDTKAYGSPSLAHLMRLHGLGDRAVEVVPHQAYELGPFVVRFVPSRHSKLLFGRKVPMDGPLTCEHLHGLAPGAYKCGAVFGIRIEVGGVSIYHQGSADLNDGELRDGPVDVFLAGVAGRSVTPRYWERILPRLDPRVVVPTHYDNFFSPLGRPQDFVPRVDAPSARSRA